jgi:glycosyltransferase involved in cell wall biosynthesis
MIEISVVVPVMNEEANIMPLLTKLRSALNPYAYELIFVDDGSSDNTVNNLKLYAGKDTTILSFNRNYGQTAAMAAGIDYARGAFIATLDGDMQNDPEDIPLMLQKMKTEGWDVVAGNRKKRQDGVLFRKLPSQLANRMIRNLTGVFIHDYGCTLKVFRKELAKQLGLYGELHRFIPVLAVLQGGKITEMDVRHHSRLHGKSKYGLGRTFKVASDLLLMIFFQKYFRRPIHLFGPIGIVSFSIGLAINLYLLALKIMGEDIWGRPLLLLGVSLTLAGIQFLTFGLIAELIMRIYFESQNKKPYSIKSIFRGKAMEISPKEELVVT